MTKHMQRFIQEPWTLLSTSFKNPFSTLLIVCMLALGVDNNALGDESEISPFPTGVVGSLYDDPDHLSGGVADILKIASWRNYCYVALRDGAHNQQIDVWDISIPSAAQLVDSLDYGDVIRDFTPLAIVPFDEALVIQANERLEVFQHQADGQLQLINSHNLITGLGGGIMTQLSMGGRFGSHVQQVALISDDVPLEQLNQEVIINFTNPLEPFMVRAAQVVDRTNMLTATLPVNAVFDGEAASIAIDGDNVTLVRYHQEILERHLSTFWSTKLEAVFNGGVLDLSLGALIDLAIGTLDLPTVNETAIANYSATLDMGDLSIEGLILRQHLEAELLVDVLATYDIDVDEPLGLALQKIVFEGFTRDLEAQLAEDIYGEALSGLYESLLAVDIDAGTLGDLEATVGGLFDLELDAQGIVEYLTLTIISPLLGDPEFLTWTLDELIAELSSSDVAALIDEALSVLENLSPQAIINVVLDGLDLLGIDISLPDCAAFPSSVGDIMHMALFLNNAELDGGGLAWFELLKYYDYLINAGENDLGNFVADLDDQIREMHLDLGDDFLEKLTGGLGQLSDINESFASALDEFAAVLPARDLVARPIAAATMGALETLGLDESMTVREAFTALDLPMDFQDNPTGTIEDLLEGLSVETSPGTLAINIPVQALFNEAGEQVDFLEMRLHKFLGEHLQAAFGASRLDLSLEAVLTLFLANQMDLGGRFAEPVGELLAEILGDHHGGIQLGTYVTDIENAIDGDCIATWKFTLQAITIALSNPATELGAAYSGALDLAIDRAYDYGIDFFVGQMLDLLVSTIFVQVQGDWSSLTSQLVATTDTFAIPLENRASIRHAFVWQDRVGVIVADRISDFELRKWQVSMDLFHPDDRAGSAVHYDLGIWSTLNFIYDDAGAVYLGGGHFVDDEEVFASGKAVILDVTSSPVRKQVIGAAGMVSLASAGAMVAANEGQHLALITGDTVTFLPNATGAALPPESPVTLAAPTGLSATEGSFSDFILVTWDVVNDPLEYRVYRSEDGSTDNALAVNDWIGLSSFEDWGGVLGVEYTYCVRARSDVLESDFSAPASGWLMVDAPAQPDNVTATEGSRSDDVRIDWEHEDENVEFRVYRGATDAFNAMDPISDWIDALHFDDLSAEAPRNVGDCAGTVENVTYFYRVIARNVAGESEVSDASSGYRGQAKALSHNAMFSGNTMVMLGMALLLGLVRRSRSGWG
jgi:hypothetical protein